MNNNRYIITKNKDRYTIWEKPVVNFFRPNSNQLLFVKTYKTLAAAKKYIQTNNDHKYRSQIQCAGANNE
jgi:hypothetical protein